MSIVTVHGPNTFGSRGVVEAGAVMATVNPANGLIWDFRLDRPTTRLAADFSWAFPPNGTPTPQAVIDPTPVTYATAGSKTATLTVTGAGAGANPYPPAGSYPITITAVSGAAPMLMGAPEEGEEPSPEEEIEEAEGESHVNVAFDPGAHTIAEVLAFVDENPDQVREMIDAEEAGKNRSTLITQLEALIPYDPGDYNVDDVVLYAQENPEQLEDIIAAEQAGKNRSTLLTQLEALRA